MKPKILTNTDKLDRYIVKIEKIFSTDELLNTEFDKLKIASYYKNSYSGYKYLHSKNGSVHLALNYDGIFNENGYLTQAKEISELLKKNPSASVLELGCGKGFNSGFLAKEFPEIRFFGIDITDRHLAIARKIAKRLPNLEFSYGDFHELKFNDASFDLIFELDSICHARDHEKVLRCIHSKLKKGGQFVLYNGFRTSNFDNLPDNLKQAAKLTEKSMAVNAFPEIDNWLKLATDAGFTVKSCDNLSEAILPNLGRFQRMARAYYKYPFLSRLFLLLLPKAMVMNSIAGLLMPFTVKNQAQGYYRIILES